MNGPRELMRAATVACSRCGVSLVFVPHVVTPRPPRILVKKMDQDAWVKVRAELARELVNVGWSVLRVGVALTMSTDVVQSALASRGEP